MVKETTPRWLEALFFVAVANFILYVIIALSIGGDAVNGKAEGGRYYLANHGRLTEVSYGLFIYSKIHTYSLLITHPLAIIGGVLWNIQKRRKKAGRAA